MLTAQNDAPYLNSRLCFSTCDEALSVGSGDGCIKHGVGVAFPVTMIWRSTDGIEGEIIDSRGYARRPRLIPRSCHDGKGLSK